MLDSNAMETGQTCEFISRIYVDTEYILGIFNIMSYCMFSYKLIIFLLYRINVFMNKILTL